MKSSMQIHGGKNFQVIMMIIRPDDEDDHIFNKLVRTKIWNVNGGLHQE